MQDWAEGRGRFQVVEDAKTLVADYRKETQSNAGRHYRDYSDPEFERVYKSHFAKLQRMREEAERRGTLVEELETVGAVELPSSTAGLSGRTTRKAGTFTLGRPQAGLPTEKHTRQKRGGEPP